MSVLYKFQKDRIKDKIIKRVKVKKRRRYGLKAISRQVRKSEKFNSLSVTLALAYYSAKNSYEIFREFPSGKGFADLTFIPRRGVDFPAMVIELKYNNSADNAIEQIKEKNYTEKLSAFCGEILLVGISYNDSKGHSCIIEKIVKQ